MGVRPPHRVVADFYLGAFVALQPDSPASAARPAVSKDHSWLTLASLLNSPRFDFARRIEPFLLLLALAAFPGTLRGASNSAWGRTVVDIRLKSDADLTAAQFPAEIAQKKDEPLDRSKVAASLKNLYATGRFLEISAEAQPEGKDVVLVFQATARYFAGVVRVKGAPQNLDAAALASASAVRLGQPLSEETLTLAKARITALLAGSAYYRAKVEVRQERHCQSAEADLIFTVSAGPAARLGAVDFTGDPGLPQGTLIRQAHWKIGMQLTSERLERGLSRLRSLYVKFHHLQATAAAVGRTNDLNTDTERLTVRVDAGPKIRIRVAGARISDATLRGILPAYRQASTDELTLLEGEQDLRDYFQQRGYYQAQVKLSSKTAVGPQSDLSVTYQVNLGPAGKFLDYVFRGNSSISAADLDSVVVLQPAAFLESRRGRFDNHLLDRSVAALTVLYQTRGFPEVKVTPDLNDNYAGQPHHLFVTFNIQEGSPIKVRRLNIAGLAEDAQKQIGSSMLTLPGKPYSPERARTDRDSILAYLANHGYSQATVDWHASEPTAQHEVDVDYRVLRGPQETVQRVVVLGNEFTRPSVIEGKLTVEPGQPLSQSALLETQQHLYDLGLFNQVQVATQGSGGPGTEKTVLVGIEEAKRWTLGYGGGLDVQRLPGNNSQGQYGASPRVSLEVDRINLGGRPQTYTLTGHFSNLEKIGSTSYEIPNFLGHSGLDLRITGLANQSRDVLTFNSKRQEAAVILQKRYGAHSSLLGRYNFRRVSVSNLQISEASIPLFSQSVLVATVGGSYLNDHRDNPVDSTRGSFSSVDADVAWTGLGSAADFGRLIGQNSTYYRLGSHLILARNTRLGVEPTFGHTAVDQGVPLPERFFLGGADSHRGFSLNEAGPRDPITGFPLGGKALFLNQVELRLPLQQNRLGLVAFEDAGNIYTTVREFKLLKFTQSSPTDFNYDVQAAGLGLRYRTPVGPLRFDVAYSPNIPRYDVCTNPSLTVCPAGEVEVLRLPRFQFVLSVGQSF